MAAIDELIQQIQDPTLRDRIQKEVNKMAKQKKFGLVFEEHLPECTPLYDMPIYKGTKVAKKTGKVDDIYIVLDFPEDGVLCKNVATKEEEVIPNAELVAVAEFGEAIYPYLKPIDTVCNAPDSDLWHTLIEADNYHALQLLEYLYAGKVDCIYIDPPYNTGARDWKYNNDYVDSADTYRHSKWLSFMEKRLKLAKKLLKPQNSVLIVTIDEREQAHLGCMLEELFPNARIQMISTIINPKGVAVKNGFKRADEYIYVIMFGEAGPAMLPLGNEWNPSANKTVKNIEDGKTDVEIGWTSMMRRGSNAMRVDRPGLYYAIYAEPKSKAIVKVGKPIAEELDRDKDLPGLIQILPIRADNSQGRWQVGPEELRNRIAQGRVRLGRETAYGYVVNYLPDGEYGKILSGEYIIKGYDGNGAIQAFRKEGVSNKKSIAPTQWKIASHDASAYGSSLLSNILLSKRFSFPKSLYAVRDTLNFFVSGNKGAVIVDFFAGSGSTLHAVNLLNKEDGGHRKCIMVTNNEVSDAEAKDLLNNGFYPGDEKWESLGIARYVTWPRTVCTIEGHDINGNPLKGNYLGSDIPMANGFKANAAFFKLGFLNKNAVALGTQFKELLPVLWMKSGSVGPCPGLDDDTLPEMLVLPENRFAVLLEEYQFAEFERQLAETDNIDTVFIVTDSEVGYKDMIRHLNVKNTYQLYRDYLDNFRINVAR